MSRIVKKIAIFFLIIFLTNCEKKGNQIFYDQQDYFIEKGNSDKKIEKVINKISYYEPLEAVDDLLQSPEKNLNIAIVAPITGKYSDFGNMMVKSALLTTSRNKYNNTGTIKVYDIEKLVDKNWEKNKEVQRLIEDNNDVIIGSFFTDTTKKLLSVLPKDKLFISFINNEELAKSYPNLVVLSMTDGYKINSLFQYLRDTRRQFLSLVLPATKKGYAIEKLFRSFAPYYDVNIITSQFYQKKSNVSILAAVRGVNKSYTATYIIDSNGKLTTETYKNHKLKKQNIFQDENERSTKTVETNAIYIEADEGDLTTILDDFEKLGILNKNVQFVSSAVFDLSNSMILRYNNVYYIGYNYNFINYFNEKFRNYFKHEPNYIAYVTYDILTMLYYLSNEEKMLPRKLYNEDGFRGVLDEFRFSREGIIERRLGIYKIQNSGMTRLFIPDDYLPFDISRGKINQLDLNLQETKNNKKLSIKKDNKISGLNKK